jgi:NAD(P)-dependent dehydrogenase (short-subunit alcohol dehydrogenase family)
MSSQRTYAVTGAASGIGRATAELLAQKGARVFGLDVNAEGLRDLPRSVDRLAVDVANPSSVEIAAQHLRAQVPGLDGLVNCAGLIRVGAQVELTEEDVQRVMQVNGLGAWRVTRALFPLLEARRGRVVNISSETARFAAPFNGLYSMSKYALEAHSDALRRELATLGMKVVSIQPGGMQTALFEMTVPLFDKALAGTKFQAGMRQIRNLAAKAKGAPPSMVAEVVWRALTTKSPRPHYRVGDDLFRRSVEFLPEWLADAAVATILKGRRSGIERPERE